MVRRDGELGLAGVDRIEAGLPEGEEGIGGGGVPWKRWPEDLGLG